MGGCLLWDRGEVFWVAGLTTTFFTGTIEHFQSLSPHALLFVFWLILHGEVRADTAASHQSVPPFPRLIILWHILRDKAVMEC